MIEKYSRYFLLYSLLFFATVFIYLVVNSNVFAFQHHECEGNCEQESTPSATPAVGGPLGGGSEPPRCPVVGLPQKVDQIWFSNITNDSVTVHWSNHGDATKYHLAYGFESNKWLWGVEVDNVNSYTIKDLPPFSSFYISIIPLDGSGCSAEPSDPGFVKLGELAKTGGSESLALLIAGLGVIGLGMVQAQKIIRKPR